MVQQLLESFAAQQGQPGPVSSLLREMGISIPTATAATDAAADDDDMVVESVMLVATSDRGWR
jgi:hypothetical protein